ncbi:MAG: hypothetical protein JWQ68_1639, partial [Cryobacterium sp.]|nr:hypothetical protein [Cryobacterium sp.]
SEKSQGMGEWRFVVYSVLSVFPT